MNVRWLRFVVIALAAIGRAALTSAAEPHVDARIEIPAAESYVLGDDIPLVWEFTNRSTNSVAMLWEGCCRLNGKLDIQSAGQTVETLPPGASAFHSFSKAAELPPEVPTAFSSLLSDWVKIPRGGTFNIGGRYTGVLPTQTPQVAEGLELWKGTATASTAGLTILSVDDYLGQRQRRSGQRGIELTLSGPAKIPPVAPITLSLNIKNIGPHATKLAWPGTLQLWIVDERGFRLEQGTKHLRQPGELMTLQPGQAVVREFQMSSADLSGGPFGNYRVFLDFGQTEAGAPRVPSNAVDVDWTLSADDLVQLLNDASGGPAVGMRNPPLKLLRLYLSEVAQLLPAVSDARLNAKAAELKQQLELARCVQPIAPKPGLARLMVAMNSQGTTRLQLPGGSVCESLASKTGVEQIEAVYGVRRHLGWDIEIEVVPEPQTRLDSIFGLAADLGSGDLQLAAPLTTVFRNDKGQTNTVLFPTQPPSVNLLIQIPANRNLDELLVAAAEVDPKKPAWMNLFSPKQIQNLQGAAVKFQELPAWADRRGITQPQVLIIAEGSVQWDSLTTALKPLFGLSSRLNVIRRTTEFSFRPEIDSPRE